MHAVFKNGCRQYHVKQGDVLDIDFTKGNDGDKLSFDNVLLVGEKIGAPLVKGAKVEGTIKKQYRADKVIVFKYKRRKNYKRRIGHRQPMTTIEITKIVGG